MKAQTLSHRIDGKGDEYYIELELQAFLMPKKQRLLRDGKKDNFSNNKISGNPPCKRLF